jgi:hypothetical protein
MEYGGLKRSLRNNCRYGCCLHKDIHRDSLQSLCICDVVQDCGIYKITITRDQVQLRCCKNNLLRRDGTSLDTSASSQGVMLLYLKYWRESRPRKQDAEDGGGMLLLSVIRLHGAIYHKIKELHTIVTAVGSLNLIFLDKLYFPKIALLVSDKYYSVKIMLTTVASTCTSAIYLQNCSAWTPAKLSGIVCSVRQRSC